MSDKLYVENLTLKACLLQAQNACIEITKKLEEWKERGDILFDENQHLYKQYNELADRLRKSQEDNERLCKILIELGFGNRIETE